MARLTFTSRSTGFFVGEAILVWGQRARRFWGSSARARETLLAFDLPTVPPRRGSSRLGVPG